MIQINATHLNMLILFGSRISLLSLRTFSILMIGFTTDGVLGCRISLRKNSSFQYFKDLSILMIGFTTDGVLGCRIFLRKQCFRSGFFPRIRIKLFFCVRIRIRIGQKSRSDPEKSGSVKKTLKARVKVEKNVIFHILHS